MVAILSAISRPAHFPAFGGISAQPPKKRITYPQRPLNRGLFFSDGGTAANPLYTPCDGFYAVTNGMGQAGRSESGDRAVPAVVWRSPKGKSAAVP